MDMFILAEVTSKMDFSGIWCLASIGFLFIAFIAYCFGPVNGSCFCLFLFVVGIFATGDSSESSGPLAHRPNPTFITNRSQTKWISRYKYTIRSEECYFSTPISRGFGEDILFIPVEEMVVIDDVLCMISTGKRIDPFGDDAYLYKETIAPANAPVSVGGMGVPQWVYHPASIWVFGLAGLPALAGGAVIASKIKK
jgi:hypothetical protein